MSYIAELEQALAEARALAANELRLIDEMIAQVGGNQAMNTQEIAAKIARAIFECGDEPERLGGKTTRIQFRGRNDLGMGGLAEEPLARVIADALQRAVKP